jgi:OmpR family response regulator RpaB
VRALVLSVAGYRVLTATIGEDALRVFRLNPVDLVIIDLWQLKSTGTEVVDQMKWIHPKVPVILLSRLADLPSGFATSPSREPGYGSLRDATIASENRWG